MVIKVEKIVPKSKSYKADFEIVLILQFIGHEACKFWGSLNKNFLSLKD